MYTLAIKECPDQEALGEYHFKFPVIRIGRAQHSSHLPVQDIAIAQSVLLIKDQPDGILVWEQNGGFYKSNGKKISGRKLHRIGDSFSIGETTFEVVSHSPGQLPYDVEARYDELTEKNPYMADLFWSLKQEMLRIEKEGDI